MKDTSEHDKQMEYGMCIALVFSHAVDDRADGI